ncbi:hypothetical protein BST81_15260 [Leptolyngbya sp. 'hensonii']|uniref:eCIS core domain-containing protein n=1 Tax=Leptolyngbya sp. 'hensonii' TaxID=1922337 RepID=UPI00094F9C8F|nr:DUF4157 domain-containing protein [Leptolyngbya sp. 'hensonii']OLP17676.1 hypothetical protein BST81_15260 [Leptolyngbya sp. 'hensonii']
MARYRKRLDRQETPVKFLIQPAQGLFQPRPFPVQAQVTPAKNQQSSQASRAILAKAEKFGHHPHQISVVSRQPGIAPGIQTKLTVGKPRDVYEQQADAVAQQVAASSPSLHDLPIRKKPTEDDRGRPAATTLDIQPLAQSQTTEAPVSANPALEQSIERKRGRGIPLSEDVREPMERSFGADFSGVNVHMDADSDQLNRSLSSRAFTTQQDIFFRSGEYSPSSRSGKELLAHELTHVVQQNGRVRQGQPGQGDTRPIAGSLAQRSPQVIQRDVGFEFEVGKWNLEKLNAPLTPKQKTGKKTVKNAQIDPNGLNKDTVVHAGPNFNLKPDQGDDGWHIEFVIEPPLPETSSGKKQLKTTMNQMKRLGDLLISMRSEAKIKRTNSPFHRILSADAGLGMGDVLITPFSTMPAEPQVTAGIRLDQLASIMEKMSPANLPGETPAKSQQRKQGAAYLGYKNVTDTQLVSSSPAEARARFADFPGKNLRSPDTASDSLISLLALMRAYLDRASRSMAYAKTMAPLMARTDFAKTFNLMPEATYYRSYPNEWVALVLHVAGMTGQGNQPFFTGAVTYTQGTDLTDLRNALSREQWVRGISQGTDYLTEKNFPDQNVAAYLFGLGKLGKRTDKVGQRRKFFGTSTEVAEAPIFEFRRMAGDLPHTAWPQLALELFTYFKEANDLKDPTFTAEKTHTKRNEEE